MYIPDKLGRVAIGKDTFLAPFGYFEEDYKFVVNFLRSPWVAKRTFHDNFDENALLGCYSDYLKNGIGWIAFHKNKRCAFIILELVSSSPLIYSMHGGLSRALYGNGQAKMAIDFIKYYVFDVMNGHKLEAYVLRPNNLLSGYYARSGLVKECEMQDRIMLNGVPSPITIYGLTKETEYGRRRKQGAIRANTSTTSSSAGTGTGSRNKKNSSRKKRKSRSVSRRQRNKPNVQRSNSVPVK
jgi:RimJ/RimL family protein N-acetyltransferase